MLGVLTPMLVIVLVVGLPLSLPMGYLVLDHRKRQHLMKLHHIERMAAIERGMEIPPLPIEFLGARSKSISALLPGLLWLFVGLALIAGLYCDGLSGFWVWGFVPTAVGLAYLVYYFIEGRKVPQQLSPSNRKTYTEK